MIVLNIITYRYIPIKLEEILWKTEKTIVLVYKLLQDNTSKLGIGPGHFILLWVPGHEAIPLVPILLDKNTVVFIVKSRGSTTQLLVENPPKRAGIIGPLGREIEKAKLQSNILLIGGGTGVATLLSLISLATKNYNSLITLIYGAKNSLEFIPINDIFYRILENINTIYVTEDGSIGLRGKVTDALAYLDLTIYDVIIAVGPIQMLCNIYHNAQDKGYIGKLLLGLETIVKCGMGFCGSCLINNGNILLCREGPIFKATELTQWANSQC